MMLFTRDSPMEFFINLPVSGVKASIADHFIMLFRDMLDEAFYEFHNGDSLFHKSIIFMAVVMEGDKVTIIFIDAGGGNNGTAKVASNIFHNCFGITFVWFGINIEAIFVFSIALGFYLFKGRSKLKFHFIQESSTESITEERVVEIINVAPEPVITVTAFRNEAMNVRIPF